MTLHDRALADIAVANQLLSPLGNPSGDEGIYDIASYHVQQSIEKELKYILVEECGTDENELKQIGHDIDILIDKVESEVGIIISDALKLMAKEITEWEASSRYGSSIMSTIDDIDNAINEFELLKDYYQEFVETRNDIEQYNEDEDLSRHDSELEKDSDIYYNDSSID